MQVELTTLRGKTALVNLPDFSSNMTEPEEFQQFLSHFKVSGFVVTTDGEGVFYHSIERAAIKKEASNGNVGT